jgi:hypothetical protein
MIFPENKPPVYNSKGFKKGISIKQTPVVAIEIECTVIYYLTIVINHKKRP